MSFLTKVWRIPALALGLAVFATACADDEGATPPLQDGPEVTGTISGTVTSATGGPIVGALVGTTPATTTALTDASGNFSITNIPITGASAAFAVTATAQGFQPGTTTTTLSESSPTANVSITLNPIPVDEPPPVDTTGELNILVTNRNGAPQSGVDVDVSCVSGFTGSDTTNDDGFVLFSDIEQGACTVSAQTSLSGIPFQASGGVNVVGGETAFIQLSLARDFGQSVFPNVNGNPVDLKEDPSATIRFVSVPGVGDNNPGIDCNIIRTQHLFIAEVVDGAGNPVSGVKVQWDLNISENGTITIECPDLLGPDQAGCGVPTVPGNTGSVVDSDDPDLDPARARSGLAPSFNVDTRKAVTFTDDPSSTPQTVRFGGQNVEIGAGQTWILITSPVEGVTDVIAASQDLAVHDPACATKISADNNPSSAAPCDKAIAVKRWVNWDVSVAELTWPDARRDATSATDPAPTGPESFDPHDDTRAAGPSGRAATFFPITEDQLVTNILDRREGSEPANDGEGCLNPGDLFPGQPGIQCELTGNRTMFIAEVERLRPDSPFNLSRGVITWMVLDDVPNVEFWGTNDTNGANESGPNVPGVGDGFSADAGQQRGVQNVEFNGPTDDVFWIGPRAKPQSLLTESDRDFAAGEFDANNNVVDGGAVGTNPACQLAGGGLQCDEDDFIGWVIAEVRLSPSIYYCTDGGNGTPGSNPNGICDPVNEPATDSFSDAYQRLIDGRIDNVNRFKVNFLDEFGEVCAMLTFRKRWVTSRLQVIKSHPEATRRVINPTFDGKSVKTHTVEVNERFGYTVTAINDGEETSENVRITDTLPRFHTRNQAQFSMPHDPNDRNGHRAFVFDGDRPTFDPVAIVYGIDTDDNAGGPTVDFCYIGRDGSTTSQSYATPSFCPNAPQQFAATAPNVESGLISEARDDAVTAARAGDQVVVIQWFDDEITGRSEPGQPEDSVEVFLIADADLYTTNNPDRAPFVGSIPGVWCNIATVTDGPNNLTRDDLPQSLDADTLCHEVVEALLDIRKTTQDAVISAGATAEFLIEVANNGTAPLINTVITDTIDTTFGHKLQKSDIDVNCAQCDFPLTPADVEIIPTTFTTGDSVAFRINLGTLAAGTSFDPNGDVALVRIPTPFRAGIFCNRVTVRGETAAGNRLDATDLACVTTTVSIELDVENEDGEIDAGGTYTSDKEIFEVGDGGTGMENDLVYRVSVTNQSQNLTATGVRVTDVVAPNSGILECRMVLATTPTDPVFNVNSGDPNPTRGNTAGCVTFGDGTTGFVWNIGDLPPQGTAIIYFRAEALNAGNDVNRVFLTADQITGTIVNDEPTTVTP